jgi:hypothetical protein
LGEGGEQPEDKYFRQSLRTKDKVKAIADAEEMYEDIKYMKRRGKKIYSISIKQAVAMYIEDKAKYVGIDGANGIVEGRFMAKQQSSQPIKPQGSIGAL